MAKLPSCSMESSPWSSLGYDTEISVALIPRLLEALISVNFMWEEIGTALHLPEHIIRQCENKQHTIALKNILTSWVNGNAPSPTLRNLIKALCSPIVHQPQLAKRVFGQYIEEVNEFSSDLYALSDVARKLKKRYAKESEVPTDHWPPIRINDYINLFLTESNSKISRKNDSSIKKDLDDLMQEKTPIQYDDVFGKYIKGGLVLVEGRPGSGKSTLANKLAKDWGTGKDILKGTKVLFLVLLRSLVGVSLNLPNILELFGLNKSEVIEYIESEDGEGLCFILDGLDEYKAHDKNPVLSLLKDLPDAMAIVTSRPVATAEIRKYASIFQSIEVLGFHPDQIYEYTTKYFLKEPQKGVKLQEYLNSHTNVFHMCYLPVHSNMICFVYDCNGEIPSTETEILKEFVKLNMKRTAERHGRDISIDSLSAIEGQYEEWFNQVCELAYDMTIQSKQLIYKTDLKYSVFEFGKVDESTLGLLTVDKALTPYNMTDVYAFLHLTLQEFLTACYISHLDENKQVEVLSENAKEISMSNVFPFFCGLTKFREGDDRLKYLHVGNVIQCAFESRQSVICDTALVIHKTGQNKIYDCDTHLTIRDISERAYVITNSSKTIERISWENCSLTAVKLNRFFDEVKLRKLDCLKDFSIPLNLLSSEAISEVVCKLRPIHSLTLLRLDGNYIDTHVAENIGYLNNLKCLHLQGCSIDTIVAHTLLKSLRSTTIETLNLSINNIGFAEEELWAELEYLRNLKKLAVNENSIDGISLLNGLHNSTVTGVLVQFNRIPISTMMFSLLLKCHNIQSLVFTGTKFKENIGNDPMQSSISVPGFNFKMQQFMNTALLDINLSKCKLEEQQTIQLLQAIKVCSKLQSLDLSCNGIGARGIPFLCDCIKLWRELKILYIAETAIDEAGAITLAQTISNCEKLIEFDVSHNAIQSSGALAVLDGLSACVQLKYLYLTNNFINETTMEHIKCELEARRCEQGIVNIQGRDILRSQCDTKIVHNYGALWFMRSHY